MQNDMDTNYLWGTITAFGGILLSWFGWHYKRQTKRIDDHDEKINDKINRAEYNQTISSIRTLISSRTKDLHDKIEDSRKETSHKIDNLTQVLLNEKRK